MPLNQLKMADLQKKLDTLDEKIMILEAIQHRLDIISHFDAVTKEENEIDTCHIQQDEIEAVWPNSQRLCGLIQAKEVFHRVQSIQHIVEDLEVAETLWIPYPTVRR